ncbi:hypothetical protein H4R20_000230 [Coemansia guatemalensis]|uniref:Uncharacterized protein n=1 Tax=Coemansia guatemalensis TaxID=2761395 RepID=A0A9W8I875_9FUNG|nr:hypothetical protein H4R20_000230 [Coemansia guatemalensis]
MSSSIGGFFEQVKDKVETTIDKASRRLSHHKGEEPAHDAKNTAENAAQNVGDTAKNAGQQAGDVAHNADPTSR